MKEKDGVFGCSYCYIGLNRQNNKFQQKGLVFNLKKGETKKHLLKLMNRCFSHFNY
ncbi:unknown [Mycoplasma sp. CAG:956]|nr:unknown [Mycoplasma sp. CAG:956]